MENVALDAPAGTVMLGAVAASEVFELASVKTARPARGPSDEGPIDAGGHAASSQWPARAGPPPTATLASPHDPRRTHAARIPLQAPPRRHPPRRVRAPVRGGVRLRADRGSG